MEALETSIKRHCTCPEVFIISEDSIMISTLQASLKFIGVKRWDSCEEPNEAIQKLITNFKESKCRKH
jgi:hypothetical protein